MTFNSIAAHRSLLLLGALLLLASMPSAAGGTNKQCPVMTDRAATAEITTQHLGREVRFCCTECRKEFQANPEAYVAQLPQLTDLGLMERVRQVLYKQGDLIVAAVLAVLLLVVRLVRARFTKQEGGAPSRLERVFTQRMSPAIPLALLCAVLGWQVYRLNDQLFYRALEEDIHYATYYDHGDPPVPRRPDFAPRLAGDYYRGNDERNEKLFNGGNYRTATFHVSLVDADGRELKHGDDVARQELFVRLEIERPSFTPDFLYSDRFMRAMFLTRESAPNLGRDEPTADRVSLTELEPMQRWEALYPLGAAPCCGDAEWEGVVYVCEDYFYRRHRFAEKDTVGGARFHYGLPYRVRFEQGRVAAESDLYMGALYRTRKFPLRTVPFAQWFSHEPIPLIPESQGDDLELLGIDDYLN